MLPVLPDSHFESGHSWSQAVQTDPTTEAARIVLTSWALIAFCLRAAIQVSVTLALAPDWYIHCVCISFADSLV